MTSLTQLKREVSELKQRIPKEPTKYIIKVVGPDGKVYDTWTVSG